jgi:hypothetical protein
MLSRAFAMTLFWTIIEEVKNFIFLKQREDKRICRIYHFTVILAKIQWKASSFSSI